MKMNDDDDTKKKPHTAANDELNCDKKTHSF